MFSNLTVTTILEQDGLGYSLDPLCGDLEDLKDQSIVSVHCRLYSQFSLGTVYI